jgi:hypothetical protein
MEEMINSCKILVGKPGGNWPLGRPRHRREGILKWILENLW